MKKNAYEQYWWIMEHPQFNKGGVSSVRIEITPHMVCPETKRVEPYMNLNTQMEFWVELCCDLYSEQDKSFVSHHLWELDCGGLTWNDAVDALFNEVLEKYGEYPQEDLTEEYDKQIAWCSQSAYLEGKTQEPLDESTTYPWDENFDVDRYENDIKQAKELIEVLTKRAENKFSNKEKTKERVLYCDRVIKRAEKALLDKVNYE